MSIKHIQPQDLRHYVRTRHENDYLLVDVRQPGEYRTGHIPGARLLPLPELVQTMDTLPADKELIFYCQGGGRSLAAAALMEEEGFQGPLYNLTGGIMAWDGGQVAGAPRVQLFAGQTVAGMLRTAVNLEKGALLFYNAVEQRHAAQSWGPVFARLAKAEWAHAKTVYSFWQQVEPALEPFEPLFENLPGDILEGGLLLQHVLDQVDGITGSACLRLIELALQIEYAAYDLYRTLAGRSEDALARQAFTSLSQAEKAHMQNLIRAMELCTEAT